jgi:3-oxoacyl-[acyl-carrier protein] reductase
MDLGLKNKAALVTGASRGLGYATVRLLSQEGALRVINSHSEKKLLETARSISAATGGKVLPCAGDITGAMLSVNSGLYKGIY